MSIKLRSRFTRNELSQRWGKIVSESDLSERIQVAQSAAEQQSRGFFMFLLDSMCLPFHVFLRSHIGGGYFAYMKIFVSSLFFLLCLCLYQFGFSLERVNINPFTPGGVRIIPEISFPDSFGAFIGNLVESWKIWIGTLTPWIDDFRLPIEDKRTLVIKVTALYYFLANLRFILNFIWARQGDFAPPFSSGRPAAIWRWLGVYKMGYLFNCQTDIVKQYGEPILCLLTGSFVLSRLEEHFRILGIFLYIGAVFLALHAFIRSRPIRREAQATLHSKFRTEARKVQDDLYDIYGFGVDSPEGGDLEPTVRQTKSRRRRK